MISVWSMLPLLEILFVKSHHVRGGQREKEVYVSA